MSTDPKSLIEKLRAEILEAPWIDLFPHAERGALFVVAEELDLADVGSKVAEDDTATVGKWLEDGELNRPAPEKIKAWDSEPGKLFRFLIVQPYVLIQERGH